MIRLSVVIPLYQEEKTANRTLEKTLAFFSAYPNIQSFEIICIDDGSTDRTRNIIETVSKKNTRIILNEKRQNKGKGYSVCEGIAKARNEFVLFFDADLSTPLTEIPKALPHLQTHDIVIGSRNMPHMSGVIRSRKRTIISKTFVLLTRLLCGLHFYDTQCGFKLFKTIIAKDICKSITTPGFAFDVEMLVIAEEKKYTVKELPVVWDEERDTSINIPRHSLQMLQDLWRIRKNKNQKIYSSVPTLSESIFER